MSHYVDPVTTSQKRNRRYYEKHQERLKQQAKERYWRNKLAGAAGSDLSGGNGSIAPDRPPFRR